MVLSAYERCQLRAPELRQEHMLSGYREFNLMLAQISNLQPNLWKVIRTQTTLVSGVATIALPAQTVMVLDVGASSTKTYVVERGIVAFSHAISAGSQDITRAIAVSRNNSGRVYVSVGGTVYKSLDGGATWQTQGVVTTGFVNYVLIDPALPQIAYCGIYVNPSN